MELDGRRYPAIDDSRYRLPQKLHQANPYEVGASPLWDNHHCLPGTQLSNFSSTEGHLYDGENLIAVTWVGSFLPIRRVKPHPEVFGPHTRRASGVM